MAQLLNILFVFLILHRLTHLSALLHHIKSLSSVSPCCLPVPVCCRLPVCRTPAHYHLRLICSLPFLIPPYLPVAASHHFTPYPSLSYPVPTPALPNLPNTYPLSPPPQPHLFVAPSSPLPVPITSSPNTAIRTNGWPERPHPQTHRRVG